MILRTILAFIFWVALTVRVFASEEIQFSEPADWVEPLPIPEANPDRSDLPVQILLIDRQDNFGPAYTETFLQLATLIQSREGLAAGSIAIPWQAEHDELIVHSAHIVRDGETIDVLAQGQEFTVLRRELNLELSILDGVKTVVLQPQGLKIGDIVRVAYTIRMKDPVLKGRASLALPSLTVAGAEQIRIRQSWPNERKIRWQATPDLPKPRIRKARKQTELLLDLRNAEPPEPFLDAPPRYYLNAMLETSDFSGWDDVSALLASLFEEASELDQSSALKEEADKIAAQTVDPKRRAELALRLVQDEMRYVYVALGSGGYAPMRAEEAWARRYGDCKAKTVVLIALLRALGIDAEPALVSSIFGDALPERLPGLGLFDHVIVRAEIDDEQFWLDGTRVGDVSLDRLTVAAFHWALPLRQKNAALMRVEQLIPRDPFGYTEIAIDASQGTLESAAIDAKATMYGDAATLLNMQIVAFSSAQREDYLEQFWAMVGDVEITQADVVYDADTGDLTHTLSGEIELSSSLRWGRHSFKIPYSNLNFDARGFDVDEADRTAPWLLPFPHFEQARTVIQLPDDGRDYSFEGQDVNLNYGGIQIERRVEIDNGRLIMDRFVKISAPELAVHEGVELAFLLEDTPRTLRVFRNIGSQMNEAELENLKEKEFSNAQQYMERGILLIQSYQYEEALDDLNQALKMNPQDPWAYANRGIANFWLNNLGSAERDFDAALDLDDENWMALQGLGALFLHQGDYSKSLANLNRAIDINPDSGFARMTRAELYLQTGRRDEALSEANALIETDPNESQPHQLKSQLYAIESEWGTALDSISAAINIQPDAYDYYLQRSTIYEHLDRDEEALADLDKAVSLSADNDIAFNNRCWFRATRVMELKKALADCDRALEINPYSAATHDSRALVFLQQDKFSEAIESYDAALRISRDMPEALFGRGVARLRNGDDAGRDDIDKAIALMPAVSEKYAGYGVFLPQ